MTAKIVYQGDLRTIATHLASQTILETDAPTDNQGKGERFSPTDLLATSLGCCMVTIMGIKAREMMLDIKETNIEITKVMAAEPRRVSAIKLIFTFPSSLHLNGKQKQILENAARHCPVAKSIHPDIIIDLSFLWPS
jgi:uncharacterized OsmC-like protein